MQCVPCAKHRDAKLVKAPKISDDDEESKTKTTFFLFLFCWFYVSHLLDNHWTIDGKPPHGYQNFKFWINIFYSLFLTGLKMSNKETCNEHNYLLMSEPIRKAQALLKEVVTTFFLWSFKPWRMREDFPKRWMKMMPQKIFLGICSFRYPWDVFDQFYQSVSKINYL